MLHRCPSFVFGAQSQIIYTVTSVERDPNLFVGLNKAFQFLVKVSVLAVKNSAMVTESFNLTAAVVIASSHRLVGEAELFLLTSSYSKCIISLSMSSLKIIDVGGEVTVAGKFSIGTAL